MNSKLTMATAVSSRFTELKRWIVSLLSIVSILSFIGAVTGIAGTAVLAYHPTQLMTVFTLYLISNIAWITVGIRTRQYSLLLMNLAYLYLSITGLTR